MEVHEKEAQYLKPDQKSNKLRQVTSGSGTRSSIFAKSVIKMQTQKLPLDHNLETGSILKLFLSIKGSFYTLKSPKTDPDIWDFPKCWQERWGATPSRRGSPPHWPQPRQRAHTLPLPSTLHGLQGSRLYSRWDSSNEQTFSKASWTYSHTASSAKPGKLNSLSPSSKREEVQTRHCPTFEWGPRRTHMWESMLGAAFVSTEKDDE